MPGRRVTLEQTQIKEILSEYQSPYRGGGRTSEISFQLLGISSNAAFVAGCVCFFEENESPYLVAIWLFFGGSVLNVLLAAYALYEKRIYKWADDNSSFEYLEHVLYVGAGMAFAVGSVLWLPFIYSDSLQEVYGHAAAAWCFIFGSLALVIAAVWNAIDLVEESQRHQAAHHVPSYFDLTLRRLAGMALCCTAIGGALFVAGSFMFRPGFKNDCKLSPDDIPIGMSEHIFTPKHRMPHSHHHEGQGVLAQGFLSPQIGPYRLWHTSEKDQDPRMTWHPIDPLCVNIIKQGTWVYLWGSCVLFLQSLLSMLCCILTHWAQPLPTRRISIDKDYSKNANVAANAAANAAVTG